MEKSPKFKTIILLHPLQIFGQVKSFNSPGKIVLKLIDAFY